MTTTMFTDEPATETSLAPAVAPPTSVPRMRRLHWLAAIGLFALALLVRVGVSAREGMWADEIFSIAIATGHSLEHPANRADAALGDFRQGPAEAKPPSHWANYLKHDSPPASPKRVIRAVFLSDTNPPFYYLALWGWTRALGTGDAAVRAFSIAWAMACFPLLWALARRIGGRPACVPAALLFALSPLCAYYSAEARMYTMLWFFTLAVMLLSLRLRDHGGRMRDAALWIAAAVAGLYTHYFFVFPLAACGAWLLLFPRGASRRMVIILGAIAALLAMPWYLYFPAANANWRVTAGWLKVEPEWNYNYAKGVAYFAWSFFSAVGEWGGRKIQDIVFFAVLVWMTLLLGRRLWPLLASRRRLLPIAVALAALVGPIVIDLAQSTYLISKSRYASAALLPALLVLAVALGRLRGPVRTVVLGAMLLAWLPSVGILLTRDAHHWSPFNTIGQYLAREAKSPTKDVVIIHSIPSGVTGVARYMRDGAAPVASWVGQLEERRMPDDLLSLIDGKSRVILLKIHDVYEPAPQEAWLREHAQLQKEVWRGTGQLLIFQPSGADTFDAAVIQQSMAEASATQPATTQSSSTKPTTRGAAAATGRRPDSARSFAQRGWRGMLDALKDLRAANAGLMMLLALWLCTTRPAERLSRGVRRWLARLGRRPIVAAALVVTTAMVINSALALLRWPQPRIHDEFSHLLVADTVAQGRLTNPPHPMWKHFETFHTVYQPTYASKYPPGPGILMGLAQRATGRPIVGAWIAVALAALATWWMLRPVAGPRWAVLGALLFITHSLALYWGRSYIGGAFGMAAGALLLGGLLRTLKRPNVSASIAMAVGLAALVASRPGEGFIFALILVIAGTCFLLQRARKPALHIVLWRIVAPVAAVLVPFAAAMAYYNHRVTGNALLMPYMLHARTYSVAPNYTFLSPNPVPRYDHAQLRRFHAGWEMQEYRKQRSVSGLAYNAYWKVRWAMEQIFAPDALLLLMVPAALAWRHSRSVRVSLSILVPFLVVVALSQVWINTHYLAPAGALVVLLLVAGMRRLRIWRWRGVRMGKLVVRAMIVMQLAVMIGWSAWALRDWGWQYERAGVIERLTAAGGQHVVLVRYPPRHDVHEEWVFNGADIDAQRVIWAREMGVDADAELIQYYAGRKIWRMTPNPLGRPKLERYSREAATRPTTQPAVGGGDEEFFAPSPSDGTREPADPSR